MKNISTIWISALIPVLTAVISSRSFAEELDSTRQYTAKEVVVTGNRMPVAVEKLPSSVTVIDSLTMAQSNGISVADVASQGAGVFLESYGGNGALQSVSIRGMGADYSLILLDGQRYTTYEMNTVDLGIFSLMDVDRIEIANGGISSLYGADAMGGVVNIITKKPSGGFEASLGGRFGSFGMSGYQISAGAGNEQFSLRGSVQTDRARNDFGFHYDDGLSDKLLYREGADYSLKNYSLSSRALVNQNIVATASVRYADADRGQPTAVTSASQDNLARIHDKDLFATLAFEIQQSEDVQYSLPFSFHYNFQTYQDPNLLIGNLATSDFYRNHIEAFTPTGTFVISGANKILAGVDAAIASIGSDELKNATRRQLSGFVSSEDQLNIPFETIFYPSLRYDSFNDVKGDISPKIGINVGVLDEPSLRLRASYGKNFNVPTFNDLYWIQGGNPNLQPEHSLSFDAGIVYGMELLGKVEIEANYFSIKATDKIVWQPGPNGVWSPVNLQSVSSTGAELSARAQLWNNALTIRYTGNYVQSIKTSADLPNDATQNKYLAYLPQQTSTLLAGSSLRNVSFAVEYSFTGFRFTSADNDPRFILSSFEKCDANVSYRISVEKVVWKIKCEVNNIFNERYQFITGYPVPMRNFMLTSEFAI
ncbi:MAG: TonB-dependent receptor [Bacteroidota bacterium]